MRTLFAGTPELAVPALRALAGAGEVCGVLTNPDAPSGRGGRLQSSPVKLAARELGLVVLEPARLDPPALRAVAELRPELLAVVAYGRIFKSAFLSLFPRGGINVHPSLLPRHRGPAPIPAAILAGDPVTGVTVQRVALAVDSGAILAQERAELDGTETASSLTERLAPLGARLLLEVVRAMEAGTLSEVEQDHAAATFCRKLAKSDGLLDFREDAETLARKVRAYDMFPGTYTTFGDRVLSILEASTCATTSDAASAPPGVVLGTDKRYGILISTRNGVLCVSRLQLEARKALDWRSFLNGVPGFVGSHLGGSAHATIVDSAPAHG